RLGKFDGKDDEGFFIGYSTNSKAFRVFNNRTRIVEENLHVKFSEEILNITGNGPNWLFDIDALTKSMNHEPVVAGNQSNGIAGTKACENAGFSRCWIQTIKGGGKKKDAEHLENEDSEVPNTEKLRVNQEQDESVNSTNNINIVSSTVNTTGMEDNDVDDDEDVNAEVDMTNLDIHILVSPTPTTIIHKDHPLEQIIRDIHSAPQTRRMTKSVTDHVEPKKVIQALTDPSWIEAMQYELLQFKLQKVWTLVDLPYVKRAIGTKWIYINKKDKRGIVVRNKVRLVAQGYTQEEGIDYNAVFAPVARIEEIRLFLAYASFKNFVVYQMDVKSAFLYGKIEEEVYVCQPPEFEDPEFPDRVYKKDDGIFISQDKYVDEILKKFGFSTVKTASTPMETSKPDIMFVVCACARFQVTPKVSHLHVVKRIFRYLKGQPKLGLWYPKDSPFDLEAYTNNDYASASLDRKSTIGGCQFFGRRLISWQCKKQTIVANSTTKAEYVAASNLPTKAFDIDDWNGLEMLRMKLGLKLVTVGVTTAEENTDFDEIVDFLNANPIRYALTIRLSMRRGETVWKRAATTAASLDAEQDSGDRPAQTRFERLSKQSNDPPLSGVNTPGSGEDRLKIIELMEICTKLSDRVLALENVKTAQDLEITSLKKRVKKLEKKKKARTLQLKRRLFKVRIESSADKSLGDQEDASKQGRNIVESDQDEEISFVQEDAETQGRYDQDIDVTTVSAPITTAGVSVSTAEPSTPPTTTTVIEDEDLTIAQTLMKMRSEKSKEKAKERGSKEKSSEPATRPTRGVTMQEPSESGTRKAVPPSQHDLKDKGKAKMIKPEKPLKKKDQIKFDEEVAKRLAEELEAELEEEERVTIQREEEANLISWDNTQAMMEADYELALRLQAKEQGELTIEERTQKIGEIHMLFDKEIKRVNTFVGMDSEMVEGSGKKTESSRKETVSKKRTCEELDKESVKRQKLEDDAKKVELQLCLETVPRDDEAVNDGGVGYDDDGDGEVAVMVVLAAVGQQPERRGREKRDGQLNALPVLEVKNFTNWKRRFLCHIIGIEPQFENIIKNGHFIPMTASQRKPEGQWTGDERKAANLDQQIKSLIMSVLSNDQINSVINCLTAKSTWDDLILYHEGPSDVKESRVMDLKLCYKTFKFKEGETLTQTFTRYKALMNELDFQDSPDDEEDTRSSHAYLNDLEEEYQARALLVKSKRFFKKGTQRFSSAKATDQTECHKCGKKGHFARDYWPTKDFEAKYNKVKTKLALLSSSASASKAATVKNKGLIAEAYKWDEEEVHKEGARNGEMGEDLHEKEEQRNNLLSKHRNLFHELNACKEYLLVLKQAKLDFLIMQHVNIKILKENINLRTELKELTTITETWLNSSNKFWEKDLVFVKSSADDIKGSIPGVGRCWLSEAKGLILPNHDTGRILPADSQRNTTDPSVSVNDSSASEYDSADESSVCSTPLPPLKKLDDVEPISGPKTIKSILR
ncbi:retrovirus-related pol polyprotein from transposon TNT 1-94, partial [Tanacetum coccineum]